VDRAGADLEGKNLVDLFPEIRQTETFQAYQRVQQSGEGEQVEGEMGNREIRASVYHTPQGILAIADDITTEKQALVERENLLAEAQALYQVSQLITGAQNVSEVLAAVLRYTRRLDLDRCLVALLDDPGAPPSERQVEVAAVWDAQGHESAFLGNRFSPVHIPLIGRIGLDDRILVPDFATAENVDERTRATFKYLGVGAAAIIPLTVGSRLLGWLLAETVGRSRDFSPQEIYALQSIAGQTAVAIQNLQQVETIRARARREQILREITTRVRASTDPDTVMRTAVRELGAAFGRPAFIRLGSAEPLAQVPALPGEGDGRNGRDVPVEGGE
jgi:GAF domain-containing protein